MKSSASELGPNKGVCVCVNNKQNISTYLSKVRTRSFPDFLTQFKALLCVMSSHGSLFILTNKSPTNIPCLAALLPGVT